MLNNHKNSLLPKLILAVALLFPIASFSANTWVQGGHSGGWVNAEEPLHGMFVEVIVDVNSPTGLSVVVAWYAYIDGQQTWVIGFGPVVQDGAEQVANLSAFVYQGNDFPPLYNPALTTEIPWGEMTIEFDGCDKAFFTWDSDLPGYGSGQMELERLTTIAESLCNPDLGEGSAGDDHGNFWQTATMFLLKNLPVFQDQIAGDLERRSDVDVFRFEVFKRSNVIILTQGGADTNGELFLLENNMETSIATDEDSGGDLNFRIEEILDPGIYTVHVRATDLDSEDTGKYLIKVIVSNL